MTRGAPPLPRLALALCLAAACGGETAQQPETVKPEPQAKPINPIARELTATLELEAGELVVGSDGADSEHVDVLVRGKAGTMVLFGCDRLEARTQGGSVVLGRVSYQKKAGWEMLLGRVDRADLARLATGSRPELMTCDEVFPLDERNVTVLRQFLEGRVDVPEEKWTTATFSVEGLRVRAAISDRRPDEVRLRLWIPDAHVPDEGCSDTLVAHVGERSFALGSPEPLEQDEEQDPTHELVVPRATMRWLVTEEQARLEGCGEPWALDRLVVGTLRDLVGRPAEDADPPPAWEPPGASPDGGVATDGAVSSAGSGS